MVTVSPPPHDADADDGAGATGAAWRATFADLAALLLAFFVLVFSMSAMEEQRWATLSAGLVERLHPGGRTPAPPLRPLAAPPREEAPGATPPDYLYALLRRELDRAPLVVPLALARTSDAVVLGFDARLILRGARPAPTAQGAALIERLVHLLAPLDNAVDLRLRPPAMPGGAGRDRSAWLRTATAAAGLLRAAGFDRPLAAYATAPAAAAPTAAIEIIIHKHPAGG